ncbi:MAG: hypothetical protein KGJ62_15230 [Armatimonadetes bacterium]|nr:hypothetical protein [Armatimonadota bacterium]MDE2207524.1 hypothetical protein [Armatimonadota bacterium]
MIAVTLLASSTPAFAVGVDGAGTKPDAIAPVYHLESGTPSWDGYAHLRLGMGFGRRVAFAGGFDVTLTGAHLAPAWRTRIDFDAIIPFSSASFVGLPGSVLALSLDQVVDIGNSHRSYVGVGAGPYVNSGRLALGAKMLVGTRISSALTGEAALLFTGAGRPVAEVGIRVAL